MHSLYITPSVMPVVPQHCSVRRLIKNFGKASAMIEDYIRLD